MSYLKMCYPRMGMLIMFGSATTIDTDSSVDLTIVARLMWLPEAVAARKAGGWYRESRQMHKSENAIYHQLVDARHPLAHGVVSLVSIR